MWHPGLTSFCKAAAGTCGDFPSPNCGPVPPSLKAKRKHRLRGRPTRPAPVPLRDPRESPQPLTPGLPADWLPVSTAGARHQPAGMGLPSTRTFAPFLFFSVFLFSVPSPTPSPSAPLGLFSGPSGLFLFDLSVYFFILYPT